MKLIPELRRVVSWTEIWGDETAVSKVFIIWSWTPSSVLTPWKASATVWRTRSISFLFGLSGSGSGSSPMKWPWANSFEITSYLCLKIIFIQYPILFESSIMTHNEWFINVPMQTACIDGDFELHPSSKVLRVHFAFSWSFNSSFLTFSRAANNSFFNSALWLNVILVMIHYPWLINYESTWLKISC